MKKKLKKLLQKPLRFHHQDIHEELALIRLALDNVKYQMQELRESIRESSLQDQVLRVPEPYEHPWDQHIREGLVSGGDCVGGQKEKYTPSLSPQDLVFQEERRQRKVRRIDFEER